MQQVKVVIDTNILISSIWGGKPAKIIELWDKGKIVLVVSQQILDEYFEVLNRFDLTDEDLEELIILFSNPSKIIHVEPKSKIFLINRDADDNKFLEASLEGEAEFIISGDRHLLDVGKFREVEIVSADKFLSIMDRSEKGVGGQK